MSHTPGPWKNLGHYEHIDKETGMGFRFALVGPEPSAVAWVADDEGDGEGSANVALIAAAPDLLAALQALLFACRDGAVLPRDAAYHQAMAAIAKATGKEDA